MHILNLQKRNEANPCSGFYGFFLLDVIGFWRIFQLIPWLLTISQHTSSSDVCLSFYLIGLSILKGKASEFLDVELPVLSFPVKSSNLRSESRKLCPVHLVTQVKATVESLINVFFILFPLLFHFWHYHHSLFWRLAFCEQQPIGSHYLLPPAAFAHWSFCLPFTHQYLALLFLPSH